MARKETGKTLTKNDLAKKLSLVTGSLQDAKKLADDYFRETSELIVRTGAAKIYGLGTFRCRNKAARVGRNPRSGEEKQITARRVVTFKASLRLKNRVEQIFGDDER